MNRPPAASTLAFLLAAAFCLATLTPAHPQRRAGGARPQPSPPRRGEQTQPRPQTEPRPAPPATAARAAKSRVALVIGNNTYAVSGSLKNAGNDARLMSRTLRQLGFEVIEGLDLTRAQMEEAFGRFKRQLTPDSVAFFFYAGHGLQLGGRNYLVPTDFHVLCEGSKADQALWDVGAALAEPAQKSSLTIVVLDACRSFNDVSRCVNGADLGFTEFKNPPSGSLIAFSTSPGKVAGDGQGSNSVYTSVLSNSLRMRPSRLEDVFIRTQIEVERATVGVRLSETEIGPQVPWTNSSLKTVFYFTPDEVALSAPPSPARPTPSAESNNGAAGVPAQLTFSVPKVNERGTEVAQVQGRAVFYTEAGVGPALEMVQIPGGRFLMGASAEEVKRAFAEAKRDGENIDDETYQTITTEMPQHAVDVPGFFMSRYEVTQAQYAAVMGGLPNIEPGLRGPNLPVVNVTWHQAEEFCARLSRLTGRRYRLPSEAEWEYAARAGTTTPFAFGPTVGPSLAVYNSALPFGLAPRGPVRRAMTEVGAISPANAFGLHDMHGNVWEWCADYWHRGYNGAPTDGSAWDEPEMIPAGESSEEEEEEEGDNLDRSRVARGGSWGSAANRLRSASRFRYFPSYRSRYLGFRVVSSS